MVTRLILSFFLVVSILTFTNCDNGSDDPAITEVERVTTLLVGNSTTTGAWTLSAADVDGVDYFNEFSGLTLTFTESGQLTVENGRELFDASDSWQLNEAATQITRGDGLVMTINEITANSLILEFLVDETILGRKEAVAGTNTLTFNRV